jgi:2-polyprenyl-6-methoxyphenol hydroxylase-like FAD-dependent oxidoreductase
MSPTHDVDVLIVGAGPTGMALALSLAQAKVGCRIIDAQPERGTQTRAMTIQPRSQELLNRYGGDFRETLMAKGRTMTGLAAYMARRPAFVMRLDDVGKVDSQFTLPLFVSQSETERWFDGKLAAYGGSAVERPAKATKIVQKSEAVVVTVETSATAHETVRCKYLIGCDGAHSVVRKASPEFIFEGAPYQMEFMLADVSFRNRDPSVNLPSDKILTAMNYRLAGVFPTGPGKVRILASRKPEATTSQAIQALPSDARSGTNLRQGEADWDETARKPTLAEFQEVLDELLPAGHGELYDPTWLTSFKLHSRGVNRYRSGRIFLCGDSAHIHTPLGGQGMNTGIQDAINLGWKLAVAVDPQTSTEKAERLLDSYHAERYPVGQAVRKGTDAVFARMVTLNPLLVMLRNFLVPLLAPLVFSFMARRRKAYSFISEFGIRYRRSPIVGNGTGWKGIKKGGDRLPDGELRRLSSSGIDVRERQTRLYDICTGPTHHLLIFAGSAASLETEAFMLNALKQFPDAHAEVHVICMETNKELMDENSLLLDGLDDNTDQQISGAYCDADGSVHALFGFGAEPGYVYVRPDAYIAHIGLLRRFDEFLKTVD